MLCRETPKLASRPDFYREGVAGKTFDASVFDKYARTVPCIIT